MNFGSSEQLRAVAGHCKHFTRSAKNTNDVTCGVCQNWTGSHCRINVFDDVLTSLDQT